MLASLEYYIGAKFMSFEQIIEHSIGRFKKNRFKEYNRRKKA